ncbi:MAG: hypothetical protein WD068_00080 [Candidatus Babeliales bacterium]
MQKISLIITVLFSVSIYAQDENVTRITHISFEPTQSEEMVLYGPDQQNYPISTHTFGTLIKKAQDLTPDAPPQKVSIQSMGGAEIAAEFELSIKGNHILIKDGSNPPLAVNLEMAHTACRNLVNCGNYLDQSVYSNWG